MRKFTKLIKESVVDSMTWDELIAQDDIDFINSSPEYLTQHLNWSRYEGKLISNCDSVRQLTNNIKVYDTYEFILICKNNDPLAIVSVYDQYGYTNFKNIVVLYGHEEIVFFDCDDFTHKKVST